MAAQRRARLRVRFYRYELRARRTDQRNRQTSHSPTVARATTDESRNAAKQASTIAIRKSRQGRVFLARISLSIELVLTPTLSWMLTPFTSVACREAGRVRFRAGTRRFNVVGHSLDAGQLAALRSGEAVDLRLAAGRVDGTWMSEPASNGGQLRSCCSSLHWMSRL